MEVIRVAPFIEYLDRVHERTRRIVDARAATTISNGKRGRDD